MSRITLGALCLTGVLAGGAALSTQGDVKTVTVPPETIKTATYYDSGSRKLTVDCQVASLGICAVTIVDGMRSKRVNLRPNNRLTIINVSERARVCATGRNPNGQCSWTSVQG